MDDIKRKNKPVKIKVNHYADKKNEGSISPKSQLAAESLKDFKTPEQASYEDIITEPKIDAEIEEENQHKISKKSKNPIIWFKSLDKRHKILFIIIVILALTLIAGGLYYTFRSKNVGNSKSQAKVAVTKKKFVPTTVPSTLTGLPVDPSVNKRPVTAIMIENSTSARPQSGLDQAGVVFEAIAEGGVTRFMAIYQDSQPDYIGPVRSARPYYVQWALGFDAAYAHVGGSPDALSDIQSWNVKDLNQFSNGGAYQRITSRDAPHNVYTSIAQLNTIESAKGYTTSSYSGFLRKADNPSKTPTASTINLHLSGPVYDPSFTFNPSTNNYTRNEYGVVHTELSSAGTTTNITPKVVIAMVTPLSQGALDSTGAYYSEYNVIGSGQVYIFQDGTVTTGTWTKSSNTEQITFTDDHGQQIKLNTGQTWITAVSSISNVTYQ